MYRYVMASVIVLSLATGCSYQAKTSISPSYNVPSNYERQVAGNYAVFVNSDSLKGDFSVSGFTCSAHSFPLDIREEFKTSVLKTVQEVVKKAKVVKSPLSQTDMKSRNFDGLIRVHGRDLEADITVDQGFFSSDIKAEVQLVAELTVETKNGRAIGTTVSAEKDKKTGAGAACEGGSEAVAGAAENAMQVLMRRIGEEITNSRRLRKKVSSVAQF